MALCPQYMALCPPLRRKISAINLEEKYALSNFDATSHWVSAYLKRVSMGQLTLKCQATGSVFLSKVCEL